MREALQEVQSKPNKQRHKIGVKKSQSNVLGRMIPREALTDTTEDFTLQLGKKRVY